MRIQQLPDFWRLSKTLRDEVLKQTDPLEQIKLLEGLIAELSVAEVLHDLLQQEKEKK